MPAVNDILVQSDVDTVELGKATTQRFLELCEQHVRLRGVRFVIPESMKQTFKLWRTMCHRHENAVTSFLKKAKKVDRHIIQMWLRLKSPFVESLDEIAATVPTLPREYFIVVFKKLVESMQNTVSELVATREVAQHIHSTNALIRNQPATQLVWKNAS